jgi:hypothetical protein
MLSKESELASDVLFRRAGEGILDTSGLVFLYLEIFHFFQHWDSSGDGVDVFQMAAKVAALRKLFSADLTLVGPLHGVLAEVITQVAALAED